jgi:hypothetical protein
VSTFSSDARYAAEEIAKDQTLDLTALSLMKAMGLTIRGIAGLIS